MFSRPVLKANQPKTVVFTVFWQDNTQKKNDVLEQFFAFFQLVLVKKKIHHFLLRFCQRSSGLKKALNRQK